MILEMEELVRFFKVNFSSTFNDKAYFYCFFSHSIEASGNEGEAWEGMIGEMKNFMKNKMNSIQITVDKIDSDI
jgi:hypothetical protein